MKCHYEVLELSTKADDSEIKSAYRKLALKWHPDKNLDQPDFAKEQFQVIHQAYEVLSDKLERAWYDSHRDQILREASSEFRDNSLNVFQFFTTTCFKGYADDDGGFYSVYRKIFDQIAKEDIDFVDEKEEFCQIPSFGRSDSPYEPVEEFYGYWMNYSTKKSYSWLDAYDIRDGKGDRRLLKIIEKENRKIRVKARKERNEEIRNLVAFVKKRDKRVFAFKKEMEAKTLDNRRKQEELSKQKRMERKRIHASEKQADWLKFDNVESELKEVQNHLDQQFGEAFSQLPYKEIINCVACKKVFKSFRTFENHKASKKHREKAEKLWETPLDADLEFKFENLETISDENFHADEENVPEKTTMRKKRKGKDKNVLLVNIDLEDNQILIGDLSKDEKEVQCLTTIWEERVEYMLDTLDSFSEDEPEFRVFNRYVPEKTSKGKAAQKRARKKLEADKQEAVLEYLKGIDLDHYCITCGRRFPTTSELRHHLYVYYHAVELPAELAQQYSKQKGCARN